MDKNVPKEVQDMLFKSLENKSTDFSRKQDKVKEYKLTAEMLKKAYFVMLDGEIIKDRLCLTLGSGTNPKVNMSDLNIIIGVNGHLLYTEVPEKVVQKKPPLRLNNKKNYRM